MVGYVGSSGKGLKVMDVVFLIFATLKSSVMHLLILNGAGSMVVDDLSSLLLGQCLVYLIWVVIAVQHG